MTSKARLPEERRSCVGQLPRAGHEWNEHDNGTKQPIHARISRTTEPWTSVRRKSRPTWLNVSRVWSMPSRCSIVACRSWMWTLPLDDVVAHVVVSPQVKPPFTPPPAIHAQKLSG